MLFWQGHHERAVVTITNATEQQQGLRITHDDGKSETAILQPYQTLAFTVGTKSTLSTYLDKKLTRFVLDPYHCYAYIPVTKKVVFQGIGLDKPMPKPTDVTERPIPGIRPYELQVKLAIDQGNRKQPEGLETEYRERIAAASAILKKQCNVTLKIVAVEKWAVPANAGDIQEVLLDFQQKIKTKPATLVIGYLATPVMLKKKEESNWPSPFCNQGPLQTHILMRDGYPNGMNPQLEYLVHDLAHYFGTVHSPDPISTARADLDNGLANSTKFHIGFDPLNLLAMNIWVEQIRTGNVRGWESLDKLSRERLSNIYKTLRRGMPDDELVASHIVTLGTLDGSLKPGAQLPQIAKPTTIEMSPKSAAIRAVVQAITLRADELHLGTNPIKEDALTSELIRTAANAALKLDVQHRETAFLIGFGIALDSSSLMRENPLTRKLALAAETDAERRLRLSILGSPTLGRRRDLCQHFAISAALTEVVGSTITRTAGFAKEAKDMTTTSGFSFVDISADLAGIRFAENLKQNPLLLNNYAKQFQVDAYLPSIKEWPEGMNRTEFQSEFGTTRDPRFQQQVKAIEKAIEALPVYQASRGR